MTKSDGQLSMFDFLHEKVGYKPGEYIDRAYLNQELSFDEVTLEVGNLIAIDKSTESHEWYQVVMVEKINTCENGTRGLVDEMYFNKSMRFPTRVWKIRN